MGGGCRLAMPFVALFLACSLRAETIDERIAPILPSPEEERWLEVPWQQNVMLARLDAQRTVKPMAIWIMDGNVLGCT